MALSSALPVETAPSPEILFPATTDNNADALIDEALRIAHGTLEETARAVERVSPGGHGAERMRILAEQMADLLAART